MALSVLQNGNKENYILYDSETRKTVMTGNQDELFTWKDRIEKAEQEKENRAHMNQLRNRYELILITGGHTQEEATAFLKKTMPFLFKK